MADEKREVLIKYTVDSTQAVKATKEATEATEDNSEATGDNTKTKDKGKKSTDSYSSATSSLTDQLDKMTGGLISTSKGILTNIRSIKTLDKAIAASAIGLLLIVFSSLVAAVTRLEGPMQAFQEILSGVGVVMDGLLDRWGRFLTEGTAAFKGVGDEIKENFALGVKIQKQTRELEVNETARAAVIAKNNLLLERQLLISRDYSKSTEERAAAVERARVIEEESLKITQQNARNRLELALNLAKAEGNYAERAIIVNEAQAEYYKAQRDNEAKLRELENRRTTVQRELIAEQKKREDEELKHIAEKRKAEEEAQKAIDELGVVNTDASVDRFLEAEEKKEQAELDRINVIMDAELKAAE